MDENAPMNKLMTIEELHLFHFWPGYNFLLVSKKQHSLNCIDCRRRLLSHNGREEDYKNLKSHRTIKDRRKDQIAGVATVYSKEHSNLPFDVFKLAKNEDLPTVLITVGVLQEEALEKILHLTDAVALHIKGGSRESYAKLMGTPNGLQSALHAAKTIIDKKVHLEISYKVIPGINDAPSSIRKITRHIKRLDERIPFHLLRFLPSDVMKNRSPTRDRTMKRACKIAKENLTFVYRDDLFQGKTKNTYLSNNNIAIKRVGSKIIPSKLKAPQIENLELKGNLRKREGEFKRKERR